MKTSEEGTNHLIALEGLVLIVYKDEAGYPTIGVGHKIRKGEKFSEITREQAMIILRSDLKPVEEAINELVKVPINQNQFDALVSLIFNIGIGAFRTSTLLARLNDGKYDLASQQFLVWNKITKDGRKVLSPGLVKRRYAEKNLFDEVPRGYAA